MIQLRLTRPVDEAEDRFSITSVRNEHSQPALERFQAGFVAVPEGFFFLPHQKILLLKSLDTHTCVNPSTLVFVSLYCRSRPSPPLN